MKEVIKSFIPPVVSKIRGKYLANKNLYTNEKFVNWWNAYKPTSNLDEDLKYIIDCFVESSAFGGMSKYWNYLNKKNIEQINDSGFENFKQTVATNYYTWIDGIKGVMGANFLKDSDKYKFEVPIHEIIKKHQYLSIEESILFNTMTVLLYNYVKDKFPELIRSCYEKNTGNPLTISIDGHQISQDILSSAIEYSSVMGGLVTNPNVILELGAGSGRTAEFFLRRSSSVKYIVCDIAPALYMSQRYLAELFEERKIFKFQNFTSFEDVEQSIDESDIVFIMPHQLKLLPSKYCDLFMAIDCLHEMKEEQISTYMQIANELSKVFYFKAWKSTEVPFDKIKLDESKYKPLLTWKEIFKKDCYVPADFFEAMYEMDNT